MPSTPHRVSRGGRVDHRHSLATQTRDYSSPTRQAVADDGQPQLLTAYCLLLTATAYPGRRWLTIATLSERVPKGTLLEKLEEYEEAVRAARDAALAAARALCIK